MRTLKSRKDFEHVFTQGKRYNHPLIRMVICGSSNEGDPGRVAFVAAKRLGCAVVRNRSKRVLREAARTCRLPRDGYEIILFATPKTRTSSPAEMTAALESLCVRAGLDGSCASVASSARGHSAHSVLSALYFTPPTRFMYILPHMFAICCRSCGQVWCS